MATRSDPRAIAGVILTLLALAVPAGAQSFGVPPVPPPRRETIPPRAPSDAYVWQPGHWEWDMANERYTWHTGRHIVRRPGTRSFLAGRWVQTAGTWVWRKARWK